MKLAAFLLLAAVTGAAALDFRPMLIEAQGEGGKYTYLQFRDAGKAVTYLPPRGWKFHGRADALCLTVPETVGVEIDIRVVPLEEPLRVESASQSAFEQVARRALPGEGTKVELVAVEANPLSIDGHKTIEFTFQYVIFGGPVRVSFLYLTRGEELLCFRVASHPTAFDRLHRIFRQSLHSFAGL
jgi:hypothetical protein